MQVHKRLWVVADDGKEFDHLHKSVLAHRKLNPSLSVESAMIAVCEAYNAGLKAKASE